MTNYDGEDHGRAVITVTVPADWRVDGGTVTADGAVYSLTPVADQAAAAWPVRWTASIPGKVDDDTYTVRLDVRPGGGHE